MSDVKPSESASAEFHIWSAPGEQVYVCVHPDALRAFYGETQRGLKLLPKRGAEVGGLLWGTVVNSQAVAVYEIEAAPCEYRLGPTWTLSPQDRAGISETIGRSRKAAGLSLVGCYRTNIRPSQEMGPEDMALFEEACPAGRGVFIILQHVGGSPAVATVAYRQGGLVRTIPQRFEVNPLAKPARVAAEPAAVRADEAPRQLAEPAPPSERKKAPPLALVLAAALLGGLGVFSYQIWNAPKTKPTISPFGLQVETRADHLVLSWNPAAPALQGARGARLTVRDSGYERKVELSENQLRSGRLYYLASGDDIELRMEVQESDGRRVGESVSCLSSPYARPAHPEVDALEPSPVEPRNGARREAPAAAPRPSRRFVPPTMERPPERQLEAPPDGLVVESIRPPPGPTTAPVASPPPVVTLPATTAPEPSPDRASYAQPEPVGRVTPVVPAKVRAMMRGPAEVQVRVSIDTVGQVTGARVVSATGSMADQLADAALVAARRWRFTPARANGHNLPSEKVIVFSFSRK